MIVGWRCAGCGTSVDIAAVHPFRCPRAGDGRHHVLHPLGVGPEVPAVDDPNPFVAYGPRLAWWAFARSNGMTDAACAALTHDVADGFAVTPLVRPEALAGLAPGGGEVWVKDETGNVGGSHKGRHLVTILLHLRAAEALRLVDGSRRPLAIASCGNAAIAAATLAARVAWPIDVFVPDWAGAAVLEHLEALGASITVCQRRATDPPGDPAVLRFREAVAAGAVPFGVQGTENALCLDGGRTIGWELADVGVALDRVVVQVGGGALAACVGWGLGAGVPLDVVQSEGCAPLVRAWERAEGVADAELAARWGELMTPWAQPSSVADGILDGETYDGLGVLEVVRRSGGRAVAVPETAIVRAHELGRSTGIPVSATGTAALAALLTGPTTPTPGERVAVIFSGLQRN